MKKLSAEEIQNNWDKLIDTIEGFISDDRKPQLLKFYDDFKERMMFAPASAKGHYHNAMPGGYVEHILHIISHSLELKQIWEKNGAMINFTDEELVFAAMHHDLGKIGDLENEYYIPQTSDWHRKNQGAIFKHNGDLHFMTVTDRAVFLLQHFKIPMTELEYLGLRLTDGMYEEANKNYYVSYQPERQLKSNIAYILHQADSMATHIEYDEWKRGEIEEEQKVQESVERIKEAATTNEVSEQLSEKSKDLFDELFGESS